MSRLVLALLTLAACDKAAEPSSPDASPRGFRPTEPTPLLDIGGAATAISADGSSVVWMSGGDAPGAHLSIHRIDLTDFTDDHLLFDGTGHGAAIALSGDSIFWADADAGTIERMGRDGGAPTAIITGLSNITEVVADFDRVYWVAPDGVHVAGRDGGGNGVLYPQALGVASHVAIDAERIYWISADGTWEAPKAGGPRGWLSAATDGSIGVEFAGGYPFESPGFIAIADATGDTVTEMTPELRGIVSVPATGTPGPIAIEYPYAVFAIEPDPTAGIPTSTIWNLDAEANAPPHAIQHLHGRVSAFAVGDDIIYYSAGTIASGALWAMPFTPPF